MKQPAATPSARLQSHAKEGIATITITAPERHNCIDLATWKAFPPLFKALNADPGIRVVILTGAGDQAFCAGADIAEFETARSTSQGSRAYEEDNVRAFEAISGIGKPVIAAINGFCFGAGVGLAAACDLRIASDNAVFAIPAAKLGVGYPPTALKSLVALMGPEPVKRLFFSAAHLDAHQAHAVKLIGQVVPKKELEATVMCLAQAIAAGAPLTITAAKRAIDAAAGMPNALSMSALQTLADACFQSDDYAEGRLAFRDKRKPSFLGK